MVAARARNRKRHSRWTTVRLLLALCLLLAPVAYAAPAVAGGPAMLDLGCDNDTPPIPASPRGPGSLVIQVTDPPDEDADPFTDKDVTLESVYGTTPSWWTYKNGCTGQFIANAGTALGNITLALTGIIPNWTHALLHSVVSPDSWLQALTDPVVEATQAVTDAVWAPWLTVVLLIVGALVLWRARSGAFAGSVQAAAWAFGVLFVVSVAIQYPAESVRLVDSGVRTLTTTVITAFNSDAPRPRPGEDPAAVAVAGQMDDIVRSTQYETWLSGALGDAHSRTAEKYGPDLFKATHLTWVEANTYQDDPTGEGKDLISEKQGAFTTIAEEIERSDPVAYDHLRGEHWAKRITVSLVNAAAVTVVCGYLLIAGLVILLAYALIRLVVPLMPAAGVLFMIEPTRDLAIGWLKRIVGPLVMGPVYFLVALILLRFDTSVLATAIPWPLKVAIIGVLAYFAWTLTKPATYGLGAIGHAAGFAWAFATGHTRRARHQPPPHPNASGAVASPAPPTPVASQRVVFMPGITDRPADAPYELTTGDDSEPAVTSGIVGTSAASLLAPTEPAQTPMLISPKPRLSARALYPPPPVVRRIATAPLGPRTKFPDAGHESNTAYEVPERGIFYTDHDGAVHYVETVYGGPKHPNPDLNWPAPNATYVVGDHHVFKTNDRGWPTEARDPQVVKEPGIRSGHIQREVGKEGGAGYDGGHLLASSHKGGRERINVIAQLEELNRVSSDLYGRVPNNYYKLEQTIRTALTRGKDVDLRLYVDYDEEDNRRPTMIAAEYVIDGVAHSEDFDNVR